MGIETVEFRPWVSKYASATRQLAGLGLLSRAIALQAARKFDLAWLNRELVTGHATLERFAGRRRVLDVDDAIWLLGRNGFARKIARHCSGVIAGNECVAEHFRGSAARIWIVPTAVDPDRFKPREPAGRSGREIFTVGWSGTAWNLPYLYGIEEPLRRFLDDHWNARLLVVSDGCPKFSRLPQDRVMFEAWSAKTEAESLLRMDVGIMPLPDNEWTRAKCATKMLCYMSAGLPVVVSPVGAATEILARPLEHSALGIAARKDDWYDALSALYRDPERCTALGQCGRRVVVEHYSAGKIAHRLKEIFMEVAAEPASTSWSSKR
jgi:glycosyltransferase involved in cell wall biosynthesis